MNIDIPPKMLDYLLRLIKRQIEHDSIQAQKYLITDQRAALGYMRQIRIHRRALAILNEEIRENSIDKNKTT